MRAVGLDVAPDTIGRVNLHRRDIQIPLIYSKRKRKRNCLYFCYGEAVAIEELQKIRKFRIMRKPKRNPHQPYTVVTTLFTFS